MSYKKVKLSEICTIEKGATGITKAIEGEYPMVTMAETRISHNEYQFDTKAVLIPLVSSSGHGHASMKRIHYQEGKFAVGSILCALVPKNEEVVNARFLYNYLHFQRESILVPLMRGAANVSLSIKSISSVEINLPPIDTQISINKLVDDFKEKEINLQTELKTQSNLLSKLRQAYLQEAVMGKLTEPSQDDAKTLLADIKSQKAQLIKEGKLRKEKPLPPIKPEEIPFEIPENWLWCRLGNCSINRDGERIPISQSERERKEKIYDYYGASGVIDKIDGFTHNGDFLLIGEDGANLVTRSTPIAFIARGKFWVNNHAHIIECTNETILRYLEIYINSIDLKPYITGGFQPKLSQANLNLIPTPLPPLCEQKAIVVKVEGLLAKVSLLEEENKLQQSEVQRLMGAVLQEAFGGR